MFKTLVLQCIKKLNKERSLSSIYHLLTGKRSSQTLQDANIYNLKNYFAIYKHLDRESFNAFVQQLKDNGFICINKDGAGTVTNKGEKYLNEQAMDKALMAFRGLQYERITDTFDKRLLLFIQTATNILANNHSFIAVVDDYDTQLWVKQQYRLHKENLRNRIHLLYEELKYVLTNVDEQLATIIVERLSGYNHYGLSRQQLAEEHQMDYHELNLLLTLALHKLLTYILGNKSNLPVLFSFIEDVIDQPFITNSAAKTLALYKKRFTIEQIISIRRLKRSTIIDHLVEIAYVDEKFDISSFVNEIERKEIKHAIDQLGSRKLKEIKEYLDDRYSYFQIRLVLATDHKIHA